MDKMSKSARQHRLAQKLMPEYSEEFLKIANRHAAEVEKQAMNLQGPTMTLALQMALRELKRALRDGGNQATDSQYGLRARAKRYLADHPEIMEAAANRRPGSCCRPLRPASNDAEPPRAKPSANAAICGSAQTGARSWDAQVHPFTDTIR